MKSLRKSFSLSGSLLCVIMLILGCGAANKSTLSHFSSHPKCEHKDFFQLIAAGSDCSDLEWMAAHCVTDPEGDWAGNVKGGFCSDTKKSCLYAVATRNKELSCWQDDQVPSCN